MSRSILFFLAAIAFLRCSGSDSVTVDVDLAVNQAVNPFLQIQNDFDSGVSRGIYIAFERANQCPPSNFADFIDPDASPTEVLWSPSLTQTGSQPKQNFTIDTSVLEPNTYYRVRMVALPTSGTVPTHSGVSDCPIVVSLKGGNESTICFSVSTTPVPLCPDTIDFASCPSLARANEVCNR